MWSKETLCSAEEVQEQMQLRKDTVLCHLRHEIIVVEEEEADHGNDE